jgi:hypothetical protein
MQLTTARDSRGCVAADLGVTRDNTPQDLPTASAMVATTCMFAASSAISQIDFPTAAITSWNGRRGVHLAQIFDLFLGDS